MTWRWFCARLAGMSAQSRFAMLIAARAQEAKVITDPGHASAVIQGYLRG